LDGAKTKAQSRRLSVLPIHTKKEKIMATKQKSSKGKKVKVNKLKIGKERVEELTDKQAKKIRGGVISTDKLPRIR
jgi:hypothetical protein